MPSSNIFFDSDFDQNLVKGIQKCRFFTPTPVQEKAIPAACTGRDLVIMARTGSGKTAAYLIPLVQKLKIRNEDGIRAIIVLPTRDLAIQTATCLRNLASFTDLTYALVIGGESMEDQFLAILQNPDILIGTPGRFLHVFTQMNLRFEKVQILVVDEADRLCEMKFLNDLKSLVKIMPNQHQTILVSATLPKNLIQFSSLDMKDPKVIRLDVETTLNENLRLCNIFVKARQKLPVLVYLFTKIIGKNEQTLIFASSRYHIDLIKEILTLSGIDSSIAYSRMDEEDRQINVSNFRQKKTKILISTDLAARGFDIPHLDNVINFTFASSSKIFIHRVGRATRADRPGTAYSLVSYTELPYLFDCYLFLGKDLNFFTSERSCNFDTLIGAVPQQLVDDLNAELELSLNPHIKPLMVSAEKAEEKIKKFTDNCLPQSIPLIKSFDFNLLQFHPIFRFKNSSTFTTVGLTNNSKPIGRNLDKIIEAKIKMNIQPNKKKFKAVNVFLGSKRIKLSEFSNSAKCKKFTDSFCVPDRPVDFGLEKITALDVHNEDPQHLTMDIIDDETDELKLQKTKSYRTIWDPKKKLYVNKELIKKKMIKTESGASVSSDFATNHYSKWLKKTGITSVLKSNKARADLPKSIEKITMQLKEQQAKKQRRPVRSFKSSKNGSKKFTHKSHRRRRS